MSSSVIISDHLSTCYHQWPSLIIYHHLLLSVIICHHTHTHIYDYLISVTISNHLTLFVTISYYLTLFVTICHLSTFLTIWHHLIRLYLSTTDNICTHLLPSVWSSISICQYLSRIITTWQNLSPLITISDHLSTSHHRRLSMSIYHYL